MKGGPVSSNGFTAASHRNLRRGLAKVIGSGADRLHGDYRLQCAVIRSGAATAEIVKRCRIGPTAANVHSAIPAARLVLPPAFRLGGAGGTNNVVAFTPNAERRRTMRA